MFNPWRKIKKLVFIIYKCFIRKIIKENKRSGTLRNYDDGARNCRNRPLIERVLIVMLMFSILAITLLIINIWSLSSTLANRHSEVANTKNICLSEGCIHKASKMLKYMDRSVQPCDNFYKFACGKFLDTKIIPGHKTAIHDLDFTVDEIDDQMKNVLEQKANSSDPRHIKLLKTLYKDCMDMNTINKNSLQLASHFLKSAGGWPLLEGDSWSEQGFQWTELAYKLREKGYSVNSFFKTDINNWINGTRKIISIEPATLYLLAEGLMKAFNENNIKAYFSYTLDIAQIFGVSKYKATLEMQQPFKLEMLLTEILIGCKDRNEGRFNYEIMTIKELQGKYSTIPWKEYFNRILKPDNKFEDDEEIIVVEPLYFQQLEKAINKFSRRDHANYIMFDAIKHMIMYLNLDIQRRTWSFETYGHFIAIKTPRWRDCIDIAKREMPRSMDAVYIKNFFSEDSKNRTAEMIKKISLKLRTILLTVDWMNDATREKVIKKLMNMGAYVGYIDENVDNSKVDDFYRSVEMVPGNLIQSIFNLQKFNTDNLYNSLRKPANQTSWIYELSPTYSNALYLPSDNTILIPAAMLQGVFYIYGKLNYINYGEIGFVIGHEIYHAGFDINPNGKFDQETKNKFISKIACIMRQYGNYTDEEVGLNLKGNETLLENIADNGGIKLSYLAYQDWARKQSKSEPTLPGLDFTPSQLFWISAAQGMCSKYIPATMKRKILSDNHSPEEFRVMGSLSNIAEFANDFQCPIGSSMNPRKKCSVW